MTFSRLGNISDVPRRVLDFPSMMTLEEKAMLYQLARDYYAGEGVIVDAGIFLGASTEAICCGLKDSGKSKPKIVHSYDIALWNAAGFDKYLNDPKVIEKIGDDRFSDGENYFPLLKKLLEEHLELIDFRIGDVVKIIHEDDYVEIAFFDLLKNYERDWAVFKALGPRYLPGRTLVIQQDYFYEEAIESKIRQEYLSPFFEFVGAYGSSAVFRLIKPLPRDFFEQDPVSALSVGEKVRLLKQAANRISVSKFQMYATLAVINYMMLNRRYVEADHELATLEKLMSESKLTSPRAKKIGAAYRNRLINVAAME